MAKIKVLPMVLSELIDIALRDIRKAEKQSKKFVIDMGGWYSPNTTVKCKTPGGVVVSEQKVCVMCAAGSVMRFSLANENQIKRDLTPSDFSTNYNQLNAIDSLRGGNATGAMYNLDDTEMTPEVIQELDRLEHYIPEYEPTNPEPFHKAMKVFQRNLEKAGW